MTPGKAAFSVLAVAAVLIVGAIVFLQPEENLQSEEKIPQTPALGDSVPYLDVNGAVEYRSSAAEIDQAYFETAPYALDDTGPSEGWYFINGDIALTGPLVTSGNINLILGNGITLTVTGEANSITVKSGGLSVYAQSAGAAGKVVVISGSGISLAAGCSFVNTASITSLSPGGYGVYASGSAAITNGVTGIIRGGSDGILLAAGGTVDNYGAIIVTGPIACGISSAAYAEITNAGNIQSSSIGVSLPAGTIYNTGTIAADIDSSAVDAGNGTGAVVLFNGGTITGSVFLPNAPNDVVLRAGSKIYGDFSIGTDVKSTIVFSGELSQSMQYSIITGDVDIGNAFVFIDSAGIPSSFSQGDSVILINAGTGSVTSPVNNAVNSTWYDFTLLVVNKQLIAKTSAFVMPPEGFHYINMSGLMRLQADAEEINQAYFTAAPYTLDDTGPSEGWYFMSEDITLTSSLVISGDVNLVLGDGLTLTVTGAANSITVKTGSLSVFALSEDEAGKIAVTDSAGISLAEGCVLVNTASITAASSSGIYASGAAVITNGVTGTIQGGSDGILLEAGGIIDNYGTITTTGAYTYGINSFAYAEITNAGIIQSGYTGISLCAGGVIDNSGRIIGTDRGVEADVVAANITNRATGVIEGGSYGIYIGYGGTIDNSGMIRCIDDYCDGIYASIEVVVINSGTIQGTWSGVDFNKGGTVTNTGTIIGTDPFGNGIVAFGDAPVISNAGTIEGGSRGIRLYAGGVVDNSGMIAADMNGIAIDAGNGTESVTVINGGMIFGSVLLFDVQNSIIFMAGSMINGDFSIGTSTESVIVFSGTLDQSMQYSVITGNANLGNATVLIDGADLPPLEPGDIIVLIDAGTGSVTHPVYTAASAGGYDFILTVENEQLIATVL
ncbi:MAG: hypothetical protein FWG96_03175 [Methanomassiliicoccaceae archaeon]|nr:hypothetical protein [Methanomassiliicoccaceae archaeon]